MKTTNKMASSKKAFTAVITLVVIVAVIAVNLICGSLGPYMDIDVSEKNLYGISDTGRSFAQSLSKDVELLILSDEPDSRIVKFVNEYCQQSPKLTCSEVSTVRNPEALSKYATEGDCVVAVCPETGRYKCIAFSDIVEYDTLSYAYYGQYKETAFDADSEITNAISFVISEKVHSAVVTTGHLEDDIPDAVLSELGKARINVSLCDLMKQGIPEGCESVIINAPKADLADDELSLLQEFVAGGGNVVLLISSDYTGDISNYEILAESVGIKIGSGVVRDSASCYQNEYLIFPYLGQSSNITRYVASGANILLNKARDISIENTSEVYRAYDLLTASTKAVVSDMFGGESEPGQVLLGAYGKLTAGGSVCVLPSSLIGSLIIANYGNVSNMEVFINAVTENLDESDTYVISSVPLSSKLNTVRSAAPYGVTFMGIIPAVILIFGAVKCILRRRA